MKSVLVLLSTYNGEKYLKHQIESILSQKDVELTILVRDDGSTDGTKQILREYKVKYPEKFIIEEGKNVGCRKSFHWLIREAAENFSDFDYYAFADQDDVWFEDKLISGVQSLEKINNQYKLYYCAYQMVDENLSPIPTSYRKYLGSLEEAFILQPCIGCSMLVSPALIQMASLGDVTEANIHDAWTYRLNLGLGGKVIQDPNVHMLYRQHTNNVMGGNQSFISRWNRRIRSFINNKHIRSRQAKEIVRVGRNRISPSVLETLTSLYDYKNHNIIKFKIIASNQYKSPSRLHNSLFKIAILLNRI